MTLQHSSARFIPSNFNITNSWEYFDVTDVISLHQKFPQTNVKFLGSKFGICNRDSHRSRNCLMIDHETSSNNTGNVRNIFWIEIWDE